MLLVLLGIGIVLLIIFSLVLIKGIKDEEFILEVLSAMLLAIGFCIVIISSVYLGDYVFKLKQLSPIPNKIEILQTENSKMEEDINSVIQKYCEYEHKTYMELKPNEINFVFILYPELKSSELVVSYIETITQNRNEIKELKLEYEDSKVYKWLVYFGR